MTPTDKARALVREYPSANSLIDRQIEAIAQALTEAQEDMRERAAKVADNFAEPHCDEIATAIRSLPIYPTNKG